MQCVLFLSFYLFVFLSFFCPDDDDNDDYDDDGDDVDYDGDNDD